MAPSHLAVASASHVYGFFGKSMGDVCAWDLCGCVLEKEESELIYFAFRLLKTVKPNSSRKLHVIIFYSRFFCVFKRCSRTSREGQRTWAAVDLF